MRRTTRIQINATGAHHTSLPRVANQSTATAANSKLLLGSGTVIDADCDEHYR